MHFDERSVLIPIDVQCGFDFPPWPPRNNQAMETNCLRLLGIHHQELYWHESEGRMGFVVRRMLCDFLKPARIDDLLVVETRFRDMAGARMELEQKVKRQGDLLFSAEVTVVLVDASGRPKRFPKAMTEALKTF